MFVVVDDVFPLSACIFVVKRYKNFFSRVSLAIFKTANVKAKKKAVSSVVFVTLYKYYAVLLLSYYYNTHALTWHHDFVHGERTTPSGNVACCAISPNKRRMSFGFTDSAANKFI